MLWFLRKLRRPMLVLLAVGAVALLVKQGFAIAEHGFDGWLSGEGQTQTEWDVRATFLILILLMGIAVAAIWFVGDAGVSRWRDWRLIRAIRRESPGRRRTDT
jgi:hypothetical protein